jgi:hypothetical protein
MNYTPEQKAFIKSKIKGIAWKDISDGMRQFWTNYKNVQDENNKPNKQRADNLRSYSDFN